MGVFDEDHKISVSVLIRLLISEGFLKTKKNKSMRTIAKECLKELFDRNLILLVRELGSVTNRKYLKMHDLLRDLSLKEAEKQKFYYVLRQHSPHCMHSQRRIVIPRHTSKEKVRDALESLMPHARSYLSHYEGNHRLPTSRLLRTLQNAFDPNPLVERCYSLKQILQFVNSRHLVIGVDERYPYMIPSCIKMLWNLRTLIVCTQYPLTAPVAIWKMHTLEHVEFPSTLWGTLSLPHPPPPSRDDDMVIMNEDMVKRIPNIKKLEITYEGEGVKSLRHLECLTQLENLRLILHACDEYIQGIKFPESLKKLAFIIRFQPFLELGDMLLQEIGSLPLLQKLELGGVAFRSPTWETVECQFPSLMSLRLHTCDGLKKWTVSDSFQNLRELRLESVRELEEIPLEIGERGTLRFIGLLNCSKSAVESAEKILEEAEEMNGDQSNLRVRID